MEPGPSLATVKFPSVSLNYIVICWKWFHIEKELVGTPANSPNILLLWLTERLGIQDCGLSMEYSAEETLALKEIPTEGFLRISREGLCVRPCAAENTSEVKEYLIAINQ